MFPAACVVGHRRTGPGVQGGPQGAVTGTRTCESACRWGAGREPACVMRAEISGQAAAVAGGRPNRFDSTVARMWSRSGSGGDCPVSCSSVKAVVVPALAASQVRPASLVVMMTRSRSSAGGTRAGPPTLTWDSTAASASSRSPACRRVSGG
jgi:hypothetical protein